MAVFERILGFTLQYLFPIVATALLATFVLATVYLWMEARFQERSLASFPCPERHWLRGTMDLKKIMADQGYLLEFLLEQTQRFPKCFQQWVGPFRGVLVVVHPELAKDVLKTIEPKSRVYEYLRPWLGDGLLLSKGEKWRRNRRLLTPAFHFEILRPYITVYNQATDVFMEKMSSFAMKNEAVEITEHLSLLTLDIILQCAFSHNIDCQRIGAKHPYVAAVHAMSQLVVLRAMHPWMHVWPMYRLTPQGRKFVEMYNLVHQEANSIIKARREVLNSEIREKMGRGSRYLDFLDILLTARDPDGEGLTDEEIRAEVDTFLFEGHDTTATGISWSLYCLAKHPEHQDRVREEVDAVMADKDELVWEDICKLKYLAMCLKEAMRLYPPVPIVSRRITRDFDFQGHRLPAGTNVDLNVWCMHRNPAVWGKDVMDYKPFRFSPENMTKMDPYAFIPFSAGPRNCIGQNFALNEEKVVISRILHRFKVELVPDHPVVPSLQIVSRAANGIKVKFIPRS
ncbi:cytochrome P450 4F2-like [Branchiostoma floridae]|uniref:Cytochrome P450 4F2-like n=1 Tax=Branchiostoma floridae TaxID=7739 RepID=A0A9J7LZ64_BRAFL|nr:cytochrome P450 4F2-like [Branchiostoma floridae]